MTGYEFGDVVLVPFPFTDQTAGKKRPAIVVSSETYIRLRKLGRLDANDREAFCQVLKLILGE